ncbi:NRT2 ribosyltransferase, partial [Thryothorus ludovicianus]|nr:NRT2 ribosyltransferase [Thryothorus ludovicianus]
WPLPSMSLLALTLALLPMSMSTTAIKVVPLDMAPDSFDDQYRDCGPAMTKELPTLNCSEFHQNPLFARGWKEAAAEWQSWGLPASPLSPDQAIAVMAYSMPYFYKEFNEGVRTNGSSSQVYRDNFHYKTLHFLLTQAVETLRDTQSPQCHKVFRGVGGVLFKAQPGQKVRFGQFASTSLSKKVAQGYGTDTVFQVHTCHGANIIDFSYNKTNKEVLIPPFETFEVISVTWEGEKQRIRLRSTGIYSKYNCEWLRGENTG